LYFPQIPLSLVVFLVGKIMGVLFIFLLLPAAGPTGKAKISKEREWMWDNYR